MSSCMLRWRYIKGFSKSKKGKVGNFYSQTLVIIKKVWRYIGGRESGLISGIDFII